MRTSDVMGEPSMSEHELRSLSQEILIADDDPRVAPALRQYLTGFTLSCFPAPVRVTASAAEAWRWLEKKRGLLVLDRSVFLKMGIPLSALPAQAIMWSDDHDLVARARRYGLTALAKGSLEDLIVLLREVCPVDGLDEA
jgi:CheY-like chemotaxis protein